MKFRFETENGTSALVLETTEKERGAIDRFMRNAGLRVGALTEACGLVSSDGSRISCWKASERNVFLTALKSASPSVEDSIIDSLQKPLLDGEKVNAAILRFIVPSAEPTKFVVKEGFLTPREINRVMETLAGLIASVYSVLFDCSIEVSFRPLDGAAQAPL